MRGEGLCNSYQTLALESLCFFSFPRSPFSQASSWCESSSKAWSGGITMKRRRRTTRKGQDFCETKSRMILPLFFVIYFNHMNVYDSSSDVKYVTLFGNEYVWYFYSWVDYDHALICEDVGVNWYMICNMIKGYTFVIPDNPRVCNWSRRGVWLSVNNILSPIMCY